MKSKMIVFMPDAVTPDLEMNIKTIEEFIEPMSQRRIVSMVMEDGTRVEVALTNQLIADSLYPKKQTATKVWEDTLVQALKNTPFPPIMDMIHKPTVGFGPTIPKFDKEMAAKHFPPPEVQNFDMNGEALTFGGIDIAKVLNVTATQVFVDGKPIGAVNLTDSTIDPKKKK